MPKLFPEIRPNQHFHLETEPPHEIYVEECGNDTGLPVVFLHGGPGGGCEPVHRRFFDPQIYRIVLLDQRGCGRSRPHAELEANHTHGLIDDLERVRERLGIDQWVVFGGSWGSTLGLLYAEAFPERVLALILRGIFLGRRQDVQWFYQSGANRIFPDYWADFLSTIPESEQGDMVAAYYRRLTGDDEIARMAAAKSWAAWEGRCATLYPNKTTRAFFGDPHVALALARIESHFFLHDLFLQPNQVLRDSYRLRSIPGVIVHGRYDMICPLENALALRRVWSGAEFTVVPGAGHAAGEPAIQDALVKATVDVARRLTGNSSRD
ncbi:MAG: prolyl aminopeptidase [Arenicellales bacterium]